jgi:hypothetical protein
MCVKPTFDWPAQGLRLLVRIQSGSHLCVTWWSESQCVDRHNYPWRPNPLEGHTSHQCARLFEFEARTTWQELFSISVAEIA